MKSCLQVTALSLAVLLLWTGSEMSLAEARKSVLVIESYHAAFQWDADYSRAITDGLADTADLTFFQMDTKRRPLSEHAQRADLAWEAYLQLEPDLVILGDDNALKHLGQRFAATTTPVVYLGINNNPRHYFTSRPKNISGVLERPLLRRSIIHMLEIMQGSLNKVLILFDNSNTARTLLDEEFQGKTQRSIGPVEVHIRLIGDMIEWQDAITSAPTLGYDAIVVGLYHTITTANGEHVPEQNIITWSASNTSLPLFGYWKFAVGQDMTIGGFVLDGYTHGKQAATIALNVLNGAPLSLIPQPSNEGQFVFSRAQLNRWRVVLPEAIAEKSIFLP